MSNKNAGQLDIRAQYRISHHPAINGIIENNMKAAGIVRRIYDLGRIVIPKEIHRTLMIHERPAESIDSVQMGRALSGGERA